MIAAALVLMQLGANAASTWVAQPVGTRNDLHVVRAVDASVAWAAGEKGTWARTADGGTTWFASPIYTCTSCPISGLVAHDANSAVIATGGRPARIYVTGDGGRSWMLQWESDQDGTRLGALAFFDAHRGFAAGDPMKGTFLLLDTTDGGATWTEAPKETLPAPLEGERISSISGLGAVTLSGHDALLATTAGRVFRTADGGKTWTAVQTRLGSVHALAFSDEKTGLAAGFGRGRGNLLRTTDGGRTWSAPMVAGLPGAKEGIAFVPGTRGRSAVVVGPAGSALSTDGGDTWRVMDRAGAHAVAFAGPVNAGWKVGDNGSVRKLMLGISSRRRVGEAPAQGSVVAPELGRTGPPKKSGDEALGTKPVKAGAKLVN